MDSKDFLHKLLLTPSPTGAEQPVQRIVRERMKKYADLIDALVDSGDVAADVGIESATTFYHLHIPRGTIRRHRGIL